MTAIDYGKAGTDYEKAGIAYGKAGTNYGKTGTDYGKAGTNYGKTATNYGKAGTNYRKAATDYEKAGTDLIRSFELKSEDFSDLRLFVLLFQLCFSKDFMNGGAFGLNQKNRKFKAVRFRFVVGQATSVVRKITKRRFVMSRNETSCIYCANERQD